MEHLQTAGELLKKITEMAIQILALALVLQVLFGASVAFFPVDVVGSIVSIVKALGSEGLVGLVAAWILISLLGKK